MQTVTKITPHLSSIIAPPFLASKPMWLMWRFEHFEGEPKPRKVPYYTNGAKRYGVQGRPEDRQNLVTFEAARAAAIKRGFDGIGHACLDGDFTVIDFDRCAVGGKLDETIEALASSTYAEYSPSGEGIHLYVKGNIHNSNSKSVASRDNYGMELFATKGFVTFTGNVLDIVYLLGNFDTVAAPSPELLKLVQLRFGDASVELSGANQAPLGLSHETLLEALDVLDPDMGHEEWLRVGMALHHETGGEGFALWDAWSAKGIKYPGDGMLNGRWESFGRNPGKVVTARSLVQMANANGARISINAVSMEEFENLAPASEETSAKSSRFTPAPWFENLDIGNFQYLIKGLIPKATLGVLFGESGSGKSFIALDICFAIARGEPWRGLRTTQGRVVYVVAEGAIGFRNRRIAYSRHYKVNKESNVTLDIIEAAPNLLIKEDAKAVISAILSSGEHPALIVIDTLAQTMAGANENASEDMGKALAHCKGIHTATGAMVLLVHHAGKDSSKGARGWSGMRAAADVELEVSRTVKGRVLRTTKQKDGADFQEWGFDLEVVNIGEDQDGDVVTSCVVVEAAIPVKEKRLGINEQAILNALAELELELEQNSGIPRGEVLDLALEAFEEEGESGRKVRRNSLDRTLKKLCNDPESGYKIESNDTISSY